MNGKGRTGAFAADVDNLALTCHIAILLKQNVHACGKIMVQTIGIMLLVVVDHFLVTLFGGFNGFGCARATSW